MAKKQTNKQTKTHGKMLTIPGHKGMEIKTTLMPPHSC
jgi:hypothetical protein